jgi:hypothetical protein
MHNTVLLILAMATILGGAPAEKEAPELVTDRPDQTESSETVAPGYVQFELGWLHVENSDAEADVKSNALPQTLARIGVAENLELRLGFAGMIWQDVDLPDGTSASDDGAGDTEIGLKYKLWEENGRLPQTALLAGTTLPTGKDGFSSGRADPSVRLACSHTLSETLGLGYNLAGLWVTEEDATGQKDTDPAIAYSVVLGIALSDRLGTFIEFFGDAPTSESKPANAIDAGLTHLLADNIQVDVLGSVGLSDAADDWFIGAGLVWRLPQ